MARAPCPLISIVTPSFQQAPYLDWTIRSVIGQRYENLEYIVIDGGSTDGTVDVLQRWSHHLAFWCSERDRGQGHAINRGLARANGEVVGWLNSDDMLLPGALSRVAREFGDPDVQAICGWGVMMSEAGLITRRWVFPTLTQDAILRNAPIFQPAVFWRRSVTERIGPIDESLSFCMDREYWLRMVQSGILPRTVKSCLAAYRKHDATKTSRLSEVGRREFEVLQQKVGRPAVQPLLWQIRSRVLRLILHKAGAFVPPWSRGLPVHGLYAGVEASRSSRISRS